MLSRMVVVPTTLVVGRSTSLSSPLASHSSTLRRRAASIASSSSGSPSSSAMASQTSGSSVGAALSSVLARVNAATPPTSSRAPRLVAVSKTKPVTALEEAYAEGQRVFGENYVAELVEKAPLMPPDVEWRFIGHLQSNKAKLLVSSVPNLACIETVDSEKIATKLHQACEASGRDAPLEVLIQVNTSGEESKNGVEPGEPVLALARHILGECPRLRLQGVMTIGMKDYTSKPENFICLVACRRSLAEEMGVEESELELSMGMSGDFESAIEMGSTNVRVGSSIFGARNYG